MIRLLIVDDHHLIRAAIRTLLMGVDDIEVVADVSNGMEAITCLHNNDNIDLLLMDIWMPGISGLETTRRILLSYPEMKVIILTACEDIQHPLRVFKAGASGYLTKNSQQQTLINVIRHVAAGQCYLSPQVMNYLAGQRFAGAPPSPFDHLSDKEFEIMLMVVAGKENREISTTLALGIKTIDDYCQRLLQRLHVHNPVELTGLAITYRLVINPMAES